MFVKWYKLRISFVFIPGLPLSAIYWLARPYPGLYKRLSKITKFDLHTFKKINGKRCRLWFLLHNKLILDQLKMQ